MKKSRMEEILMVGDDYIINGKEVTNETLEEHANELIEVLRKKQVTYLEAELTLKKAIEMLDIQII